MAGSSPAMTSGEGVALASAANPYCETVCTTLLIGRLATAGIF